MKAIEIKLILVISAALMTMPVSATAADKSLACVAMVEKAEAFVQEKGVEYALKVFSVSKGPFIDKELYVFACSMSNFMLAHPYRKDLIGQDVNDFKDVKGSALFQEFRKTVEDRGSGWVDYWWSKPGEKGGFPKRTYVKRMPGSNIYVGVGYYKPLEFSQEVNQPDTN